MSAIQKLLSSPQNCLQKQTDVVKFHAKCHAVKLAQPRRQGTRSEVHYKCYSSWIQEQGQAAPWSSAWSAPALPLAESKQQLSHLIQNWPLTVLY